ncbi:mas-related G-protein coupled receptor member H-like isoform X1 [Paroedura picta]|uniref:mas-related G-protein coupled receptor member H-like isoform X1 n=1 Tax=Paroedura picta TaxID=143630 RepID=UPI004057BC6C
MIVQSPHLKKADLSQQQEVKKRNRKAEIEHLGLTSLSMMDADLDDFNSPNYTYPSFPIDSQDYNISEDISSHNPYEHQSETIFMYNFMAVSSLIVLVVSILGAVGNGVVIWLLGFRIKRNPFMTYVLNLAVADFGVLLSFTALFLEEWGVYKNDIFFIVSFFLHLFLYAASQFLLTAISIDRCVAIFFPFWYRCKRPPHLSTIVCAVLWVLSVLLTAITGPVDLSYFHDIPAYVQFIINAVLCLPVMTVATVSLFIKVCVKGRQHQRGRLLTIVLLTLLFFLLFAFPGNILYLINFRDYYMEFANYSAVLLACLNSSVNPFIYFLVGRRRKSRQKESMKVILQEVFKEEEGCAEETPVETQL